MILVNKSDLYNISGSNPTFDRILELLLRNYTGLYADYVFIDEHSLSYKYDIPFQDIINALIFFNRQHVLHYIPRRRTPYIFMTSSRVDTKYVKYPKYAYEDSKARLEKRINSMIRYTFNTEECCEKIILEYFGEKATDCKHCDICIERKKPAKTHPQEIQEGILYMLSLKPRSLKEFTDTLNFKESETINMLRFLTDEGFIILRDGIYYSKN